MQKKYSKTENKCTIRSIATQDYSVIVISYIVTFKITKKRKKGKKNMLYEVRTATELRMKSRSYIHVIFLE